MSAIHTQVHLDGGLQLLEVKGLPSDQDDPYGATPFVAIRYEGLTIFADDDAQLSELARIVVQARGVLALAIEASKKRDAAAAA